MLVQVLDGHHQNQVSNFLTYNYRLFSDAYLFLLGMILHKKGLTGSISIVSEKIHSIHYFKIKRLSLFRYSKSFDDPKSLLQINPSISADIQYYLVLRQVLVTTTKTKKVNHLPLTSLRLEVCFLIPYRQKRELKL